MTRGKIVYISNNMLLCSTEFNGDMYYSGYGAEVIEKLKGCNDVAEFHQLVSDFNAEHHHYNDVLLLRDLWNEWWMMAEDKSATTFGDALNYWMDFETDYIDNWFSDYLYIKNGSDIPVPIKTPEFETTLEPGEITSICFGFVAKDWKENPLLPPAPTVEEIAENHGWSCVADGNSVEFSIESPEYVEFSFDVFSNDPHEIAALVRREYDRTDFNRFYIDAIRDGCFDGDLENAVDDRDWLDDSLGELADALDEWVHEYYED